MLDSGYQKNISNEYFGDSFYSDIAKSVNGAPALNASPYYQDALDCLMTAVVNVIGGADAAEEAAAAQETLEFNIG